MTEEKMKELLFSLAWYDASNHHNRNAKEILASEFPGADFAAALDEFVKVQNNAARAWESTVGAKSLVEDA